MHVAKTSDDNHFFVIEPVTRFLSINGETDTGSVIQNYTIIMVVLYSYRGEFNRIGAANERTFFENNEDITHIPVCNEVSVSTLT